MQDSGRLSSAGGCAAEDCCSAAAAPLPLLPPPSRVQAQPASAQVPYPCLANKYHFVVEKNQKITTGTTGNNRIGIGFDADPDPTFKYDTDSDPDPIPNFTHVGKSLFFLLLFKAVLVYIFLVSVIVVIIFNIFDSTFINFLEIYLVEMDPDPAKLCRIRIMFCCGGGVILSERATKWGNAIP